MQAQGAEDQAQVDTGHEGILENLEGRCGGQKSGAGRLKPATPTASNVQMDHSGQYVGGAAETHESGQSHGEGAVRGLTQVSKDTAHRPSTPLSKFRKTTDQLSRRQAALLIQLRTGHIPLHKHLHRIGKVKSPRCPACISDDESVHNYLLMCPAYAIQRRRTERALRRSTRSINTLLSNPKAFPHIFKFVSDTRRFQTTFWDPQSE